MSWTIKAVSSPFFQSWTTVHIIHFRTFIGENPWRCQSIVKSKNLHLCNSTDRGLAWGCISKPLFQNLGTFKDSFQWRFCSEWYCTTVRNVMRPAADRAHLHTFCVQAEPLSVLATFNLPSCLFVCLKRSYFSQNLRGGGGSHICWTVFLCKWAWSADFEYPQIAHLLCLMYRYAPASHYLMADNFCSVVKLGMFLRKLGWVEDSF